MLHMKFWPPGADGPTREDRAFCHCMRRSLSEPTLTRRSSIIRYLTLICEETERRLNKEHLRGFWTKHWPSCRHTMALCFGGYRFRARNLRLPALGTRSDLS